MDEIEERWLLGKITGRPETGHEKVAKNTQNCYFAASNYEKFGVINLFNGDPL